MFFYICEHCAFETQDPTKKICDYCKSELLVEVPLLRKAHGEGQDDLLRALRREAQDLHLPHPVKKREKAPLPMSSRGAFGSA